MKKECGQAFTRIVRGAGHQDEVFGQAGTGDKPFMAVDAPAVSHTGGFGAHHPGRIRARTRGRFGHDKGGAHLTVYDGLQPSRLLRRRAYLLQHHHVAVIRRRAVEHNRPKDRSVHLFVAGRHTDNGQALSAPFHRHLQCPEPFLARAASQRLEMVGMKILTLVVGFRLGFQGQDVGVHECANALAQILDLGAERIVHRVSPAMS